VRLALKGVEPVPEVELSLDASQEADLPGLLAASADLAKEPSFGSWLRLPAAQMAALQAEMAAADAATAAAARQRVYQDWLNGGELQRLAVRLDIQAWLLHCTGRSVAALQAIAVARALRAGGTPWTAVPLLTALMQAAAPLPAASTAAEAP
jgi:hypothetical protein